MSMTEPTVHIRSRSPLQRPAFILYCTLERALTGCQGLTMLCHHRLTAGCLECSGKPQSHGCLVIRAPRVAGPTAAHCAVPSSLRARQCCCHCLVHLVCGEVGGGACSKGSRLAWWKGRLKHFAAAQGPSQEHSNCDCERSKTALVAEVEEVRAVSVQMMVLTLRWQERSS